MQPVATRATHFMVCMLVCLCLCCAYSAKMDELIEMPFRGQTLVVDGGHIDAT